ncbi:MAG: PspC domain-containing protein [Treponema sp.]|nr:PspC domain-containing protein [Treponema sp.]
MSKKLYKSRKNKMIDGVCGGLADFFSIDATIIRLIFALAVILKGAGILLYIIACIIIPREPDDGSSDSNEADENVENLKSANINDSEKDGIHTDEEFDEIFRKKC